MPSCQLNRGDLAWLYVPQSIFLKHPTPLCFPLRMANKMNKSWGGGGGVEKKSSKCVLFSNALRNCHLATEKDAFKLCNESNALRWPPSVYWSYMKVRCLIKIARQSITNLGNYHCVSHSMVWKLYPFACLILWFLVIAPLEKAINCVNCWTVFLYIFTSMLKVFPWWPLVETKSRIKVKMYPKKNVYFCTVSSQFSLWLARLLI